MRRAAATAAATLTAARARRMNCMNVGLAGIEPATSPLSGVRSNRLSYSPADPGTVSAPTKASLLSRTALGLPTSAGHGGLDDDITTPQLPLSNRRLLFHHGEADSTGQIADEVEEHHKDHGDTDTADHEDQATQHEDPEDLCFL